MADKKGQWSVNAEIWAEQKEALQGMPLKKKLAYFWEYYRVHAIFAVAVIVISVSIISSIAGNKPYSFNAIMLNSYFLDGEQISADFSEYAGLNSERYECFIDTFTNLNIDEMGEQHIAALQRIMAQVMAADLDVIVSDGFHFINYAENLYFIDLRLVMDDAELARHAAAANVFYIDQAVVDAMASAEFDPDTADTYVGLDASAQKAVVEGYRDPRPMADPVPVGIFIADSPLIKDSAAYPTGSPVYGLIANSGRMETALKYLDFLME